MCSESPGLDLAIRTTSTNSTQIGGHSAAGLQGLVSGRPMAPMTLAPRGWAMTAKHMADTQGLLLGRARQIT
ncbi:hypothetical protein JMJ77_0000784 [Colletotrichum scovillei]|uniref:Uncharacterized protein n=1 Tax=Colletotrichum scovillei TaxID=1209932 RepID=A0A9P7RCK0_9PEZI|nr:hypothetical protein JMJ77_0000784 [Colletotrichum scovillei]KAG7071993.1 hypothetical protein JMJ76_0004858 [Colletotrichum scovillei]KAG7080272.1 hypothetical protein JMJ78_0007370 [Colletotrichum scovillei]